MGLRLHNTLTRTKEDFVPIDPSNVRMYVCGPTVYDFAHIGNARPLIVFDVLFRLLRHLYGPDHVTYVRNITDVDDKINARAAEEYPDLPLNEAIRVVTERTTRQFHEDVAALGCLTPTVEPRATEHIAEMKAMIETLVAKGYAYVAEGHVLFHVAAMKDYGRLSNRTLDEMIAGARVEVAPYKRDAMDFVLWKPSKPGEPAWPSPAGIAAPGRPGWHLECSAMSDRWLWQEALPSLSEKGRAHPHEFDIHGGGIDLVFPHHENEIAQSRCAHGTDVMARTWLHNGFLQVEGEKMSKSLGNFVTIRDVLKDWPGEVVRFNMLKTHYRQPIDWTVAGLENSFDSYFEFFDVAEEYDPEAPDAEFIDALTDDLNTPQAFSRLYELRREAVGGDIDAGAALTASLHLLGLCSEDRGSSLVMPTLSSGASKAEVLRALMSLFPKNYPLSRAKDVLRRSALNTIRPEVAMAFDELQLADGDLRAGELAGVDEVGSINDLIAARAAARAAKNFAEADRIRAELDAMGIALKDAKDPSTGELVTTWEVKR